MKIRRTWVCLWMMLCLLFTQASALALDPAEDQADAAMRQYMVKRVEMVASLGMYGSWPVEEKAALDARNKIAEDITEAYLEEVSKKNGYRSSPAKPVPSNQSSEE